MKEYSVLVCNGSMPQQDVLRHLVGGAQQTVCADGGANAFTGIEMLPDLVIGDFDSITPEAFDYFERRHVPFIREEDQGSTDLEKALRYLEGREQRTVVILGLTGGLLDHTLGNFSILLRYVEKFQMVIFDLDYRIDIITSSAEFRSRPGDRVSIIPLLSVRDITYSGLRYPLNREVLAFGEREGTSNAASAESFRIEFPDGAVAVFRSISPDLWQDILVDNPPRL